MIILSLLALAASIGDVRLTLSLIRAGRGTEANLVMRPFIRLSPLAAYGAALALTVGPAVIGRVLVGATWRGAAICGWALLGLLVAVRVGSVAWNWNIWRKK